MLLRQEYPWVLRNLYRDRTYQIQDLSDTGQNLYGYRSTRRYYRTRSKTGVPVGTTELNHIQEYPWVPRNLSKYRSTRRYHRTYQIQDRTYSDTGVPVGTTELDKIQGYP